ncbi:MAG: HDOD domain-containing protein [Desulfobacter sp.]|nr:MAG: HDOD domain-containing protein [Desulfobacter sp.]
MNLVNVFDAEPGMVLAREVKNREGRLLMKAGTLLGEKEIRILRMWGILDVHVVSEGGKKKTKSEEPLAERDEFLEKWFRNNDLDDPVVRMIHDLAREWFEDHPGIFSALAARTGAAAEDEEIPAPAGPADPAALLGDEVKLPSLPKIYFEIEAAVEDPRFSGREIAEIVSKDTALSASLLKIVNSAFYGFREGISSLAQAAVALGSRQICTLALGVTVINYFKALPGRAPDMEAFWHHSLGCAVLCANLATHIPEADRDRVFTGGLLHDIGRLVFLSYFPDACGAALARAGNLEKPLVQVEPDFFKMDHARFGSLLADSWNFPEQISHLIRNHHKAFTTLPETETAVVYFANWMVSALGIGFTGEAVLPALDLHAWEAMGIPPAALVPVLRQTDRQITEAIRFFYG